MACTAKMPHGKADITGISLTATGTIVYGPPNHGGVDTQGVYQIQSIPGASATLRWLRDMPVTAGTGSPSTFVVSGS